MHDVIFVFLNYLGCNEDINKQLINWKNSKFITLKIFFSLQFQLFEFNSLQNKNLKLFFF